MYKLAFLGDRKSLSMYKTAGFTILSPENDMEVKKSIEQLKSNNYSIIFVSEYVYQMAVEVIRGYDTDFLPAIIILPGYGEEDHIGINRMNQLIEQAVGIKV